MFPLFPRLPLGKTAAFALVLASLAAGFLPRRTHAQSVINRPLGSSAPSAPAYLRDAGISQNLNHELPLSDRFVDSTGAERTLGSYFHDRPVVLALVYFKCRLLCPKVMEGLATALRGVSFTPGKQYDVIVASFDPSDTPEAAASEKQRFLKEMGNPAGADSAVHFLTGKEASITDLAEATGFHYVRVQGPDGQMNQFAHSSVIMIATPDGRMSKYLSGIEFQPRDVRLALIEASKRHIATASDLLLIYCCDWNASTGRYTVSILRVLALAGMASLFAIAFLFYMLSRKPKVKAGRT